MDLCTKYHIQVDEKLSDTKKAKFCSKHAKEIEERGCGSNAMALMRYTPISDIRRLCDHNDRINKNKRKEVKEKQDKLMNIYDIETKTMKICDKPKYMKKYPKLSGTIKEAYERRIECMACDNIQKVFETIWEQLYDKKKPVPLIFKSPTITERNQLKQVFLKQFHLSCKDGAKKSMDLSGNTIKNMKITFQTEKKNKYGVIVIEGAAQCCVDKKAISKLVEDVQIYEQIVTAINNNEFVDETIRRFSVGVFINTFERVKQYFIETIAGARVIYDSLLDHTQLGSFAMAIHYIIKGVEVGIDKKLKENKIQRQSKLDKIRMIEEVAGGTVDRSLYESLNLIEEAKKKNSKMKSIAKSGVRIIWWIFKQLLSFSPFLFLLTEQLSEVFGVAITRFNNMYFLSVWSKYEKVVFKNTRESNDQKRCKEQMDDFINNDVTENLSQYQSIFLFHLQASIEENLKQEFIERKFTLSILSEQLNKHTEGLWSILQSHIFKLLSQFLIKVGKDMIVQYLKYLVHDIFPSSFFIRILGDIKLNAAMRCPNGGNNPILVALEVIATDAPSTTIREYSSKMDNVLGLSIKQQIKDDIQKVVDKHSVFFDNQRLQSISKLKKVDEDKGNSYDRTLANKFNNELTTLVNTLEDNTKTTVDQEQVEHDFAQILKKYNINYDIRKLGNDLDDSEDESEEMSEEDLKDLPDWDDTS